MKNRMTSVALVTRDGEHDDVVEGPEVDERGGIRQPGADDQREEHQVVMLLSDAM